MIIEIVLPANVTGSCADAVPHATAIARQDTVRTMGLDSLLGILASVFLAMRHAP
ncbi:MAG: hypothetical protein ACREUZ_10010 [Burkholderiales bacterium]